MTILERLYTSFFDAPSDIYMLEGFQEAPERPEFACIR